MTSTIVSWGLTICLVGGAIYIYRPDLIKGLTSSNDGTKSAATELPSKSTNKKPKVKKTGALKPASDENADSASGTQSSKKRKIAAPVERTSTSNTPEVTQQPQHGDENNSLSDKDFARQLAQAQSGTKLQVPQKQQPTTKGRRAAAKPMPSSSPDPSGISTEASSTAGRDGDDDLTPAESPQVRPLDAAPSAAGDVSDMLEAPGPKPTTLRLTDVSSESKGKKPANKSFETVLSKKKRNEKQRKEEQRLAREESDRIHEAKKQEQLRKARTAAGTSNETKANNFAATANAWQSGPSKNVKTAPATESEPLLDTFNPSASTAGPAHGAVHSESTELDSANHLKAQFGEGTAAALTASATREGLPAAKRQEQVDEMWEEDQLKMLKKQEEEDAWESVTSKKSKKKHRQDTDSASGTSSPVRIPQSSTNPQVNGNNSHTAKRTEVVNRYESIKEVPVSGLQDAEWEA